MTSEITDIWFRSELPLEEIARRVGMEDIIEDVEDFWEWVIGSMNNVRLDITRTHTKPASEIDTRIFVLGEDEFSESLIAEIATRLRHFVLGSIMCGRWEYISGNEFDLVIIQQFKTNEKSDR